jgi:anaerobic magnesium-protoporphyrin IX monomethyl ester cyclase
MKVLLIQPRTDREIATELPGMVSKEVGTFPPLGILYLAGWLRAKTDHEVFVMDLAARNISLADFATHLERAQPDVVGITAITHTLVGVRDVAELVKEKLPESVVVIGGPHVNAFGSEALALKTVDYAVEGDGERSFGELLEALVTGGALENVPGLHYRLDGEPAMGAPPQYEKDLDQLPFPARDLVDVKDYFYVLGKRATFATVLSSRGCPFKCTFCSTPHGGYRHRSADNVVDEIKACLAAGAEEIHFVDDTFNLGKGRLAAVSQAILERGVKVRWSFRGRADGITDEGMALAASAGCVRVHLGVETGTEEGLKRLRKGMTLKDIKRGVTLARKHNIVSAAYFILGCPHEPTTKKIWETVKFAIRLDPDFAMFNLLAIYPNTELFDEAVEKKLLTPNFWLEFVRDPRPDFAIPLWEEHLPRKQLQSLLEKAYRRFYLRPRPIIRNLLELRSFAELRRKVEAGMSILMRRN